MQNPRVYADRPETIQLKLKLANHYVDNIAPHELMIEAINLQNKQIYTLQEKYLQLLEETKNAKPPQDYTPQQLAKLQKFEDIKIHERRKFIQQGLKANQTAQTLKFEKQRQALVQVLTNKEMMLKEMKGHQMNVFFNLEQGVLEALIEFALKSEKIPQEKRGEFVEEIKWWRKRMEISEREMNESR